MSEYQCYEFLAIDKPLSAKHQRELRAVSTRAEISSTRFWNEYQWGNLKADPRKLLLKYFDAHYSFANWGTRELMLRLPKSRVDLARLKPYFSGLAAHAEQSGEYVCLRFWADEDSEAYDESPSDDGAFAELVPIRSQLLQGDLRAAYLGWLAGIDRGADDEDLEPPVPPGLDDLDGPLDGLAGLLGLDHSIVAAAAEGSARAAFDPRAARHWLSELSATKKERLLVRSMADPSLSVGAELLAQFRADQAAPETRRRTVARLRARAAELA